MSASSKLGGLLISTVLVSTLLVATAPASGSAQAESSAPTLAWSKSLPTWNQTSSPTIADVNGDGENDVVFGAQDGIVRVVNRNGTNLPGWPQRVSSAIDGAISVADLDRDGAKELIVPMGSLSVKNQHGGVVVFNRNGAVRCRVNTIDVYNEWTDGGKDGYREAVHSAAAIGDVTGDGLPDIVFGSWDHRLYATDRFCRVHPGFPVDLHDTLWPTPALFDINGDGRSEIFMGIDVSAGNGSTFTGGALVALENTGFGVRTLWKRLYNETIWSSPAIGDIDGNGRADVVFGAGMFYNRSDTGKVFAVHADNGTNVPGWPVTQGGKTYPSPALGDVTGDGRPDVAVGSWNGTVGVYTMNGRRLWSKYLGLNGSVGNPIIADMNGDGRNDVGIGYVGSFRILDGRTGANIAAVNTGQAFWGAGAVGKFGSQWKLITSGFRTGRFHDSRIQAHNIATPGKTPPWPMFHKDAAHRGAPGPNDKCRSSQNPAAKPNSKSSKGYWVVSARGGVYALQAPFHGSASSRVGSASAIGIRAAGSNGYYVLTSAGAILPFGTAKSHGSMVGRKLNGAIIGLASTPSGRGYWLLGSDGGIFTFGDAKFYGSTGSKKLTKPIIAMAATKTGRGYWLLGSDGGVFSFGDARFFGSTGARKLSAPIISMATAPSGKGYWLVGADGGIFSFGVPFYGSLPGLGLCVTPRGMQIRPTLTGKGYYILGNYGRVFAFGDAYHRGSVSGLGGWNFSTDLAVRP